MFIVLGVAWACALGPGVVKALGQRGIALRGSGRRSRSSAGAFGPSAFAGLVGGLVSRRRQRPVGMAAPKIRLSPAARRARKRRRDLLAGLTGVTIG